MRDIGSLGEKLVESWLRSQDYQLLYHNWHCRWGEIDLIAQYTATSTLIFVEVKTRSCNNWDEFRLLSITTKKQQKIIKTASFFLSKNPEMAELTCRFDIALVSYQTDKNKINISELNTFESKNISLGKSVIYPQGYQLTLQSYIQSAFDLS